MPENNLPKYEDTVSLEEWEELQKPKKEKTSNLETSLRGIGQYAGMGFGDEIEAGYKNLARGQNYDQALEEARRLNVQAEQENPLLYHGAGVGSDIALGLATGGLSKGAGLTAKAAQLLSKPLVGSAITGGLTGIGSSEADKLSMDTGLNMALGAALGSGGEFALGKAGKAIGGIGKKSKDYIKNETDDILTKTISTITGKPEEAINLYKSKEGKDLLNKIGKAGIEDVDQATEQITDKLHSFLEKNPYLKKGIEKEKQASEVIKKSNIQFDTGKNLEELDNYINQIKIKNKDSMSDEASKAIQILSNKRDEILNNTTGKIDAERLYNIKKSLQQDNKKYGYGGIEQNGIAEQGLKKLEFSFNKDLKDNITEYKDLISESSLNLKMAEALGKKFFNKTMNEFDKNKIKTMLESNLNNRYNPNHKASMKLLDKSLEEGQLNPLFGSDLNLTELMKGLKAKKTFDARGNQGSNIVNMFGAGGAAIGSVLGGGMGAGVGSSIGAGIGKRVETKGGQLAKKLVDITGLSQPQKTIQKASGTGYGKVLKDALDQGANKFAVTHFLLSQKDKAYQKLMNKEDK
mgnify:CR=1 FL=1